MAVPKIVVTWYSTEKKSVPGPDSEDAKLVIGVIPHLIHPLTIAKGREIVRNEGGLL